MFSIVIPTKNEEKFLPILLRDIAKQSRQPEKIIVADAHSTDKTRTIAKKFGCTVVDGGLPGVGRNCGAKLVASEFIVFLDADAQIKSKKFFEEAFAEITKRNLDIASCDIVPYEGTRIDIWMLETYNLYAKITENIKPHAPGMCIFMKKNIHDAVQGFDEHVLLAEDMDYVQRAARFGTFGILRDVEISTSTRRFRKDGHFKTIIKYLLTELHMSTLGSVKTDIFKYKFDYEELYKKEKKQ